MRLLAIETTSLDVGVAVVDESGLVASVSARSGRRHVELLHVLVGQVLELAGTTLSAVGAIAVDVGPGLFTGIRVGAAAAKGFATALAVPVVPLTSLEILRAGCEARSPGPVVPVVDLRRGEVAWSLPGEPDDFGSPHRLAALIDSVGADEDDLVLAGDGAIRYASVLCGERPVGEPAGGSPRRRHRPPVLAGIELASPPVASLAVRALVELQAGRAVDPLEVLPVYLRGADARINWTTRHDAPVLSPDAAGY